MKVVCNQDSHVYGFLSLIIIHGIVMIWVGTAEDGPDETGDLSYSLTRLGYAYTLQISVIGCEDGEERDSMQPVLLK